jgi:predicted MFS family arabinose efflux permease
MSGPTGLVFTAGCFCGVYLGLGIVSPARSVIIHDRVGAGDRTTVLSVSSLTTQTGGVVATVGFGRLAESSSIAVTWWIAGAVLLASALVFPGVRPQATTPTASDRSRPADEPRGTAAPAESSESAAGMLLTNLSEERNR